MASRRRDSRGGTSGASPAAPKYAIFDHLGHLFQVLTCTLGPADGHDGNGQPGLLPATAYLLKGSSRTAVLVDAKLAKSLERLARQGNWAIEFTNVLGPSEAVDLSQFVSGGWKYVDVAQQSLELADPNQNEYLLGAANERQSQAVLDQLLAAEIRGIRVRPVIAEPSGQKSPLSALWLVQGRRPPQAAIDAAWRTWWGPKTRTRQENSMYVQWPLDLQFPPELLDCLDRKVAGSMVLLSPENPAEIVVRLDPGLPPAEDLINVAEVVVERKTPQVLAGGSTPALQFPVHLRLVSRSRPVSAAERLRDLKMEIDVKKRTCSRLEQEIKEDNPYAPPFYEPLFLYIAPRGEVPEQLRRLLIECCDQRELRSLRYLRTELRYLQGKGDQGANGGGEPEEDLHLLTTDTALTSPDRDGKNFWLKEYQPGQRCVFRLLPEWQQQGLRLFVPDDQRRLDLYPDIGPGPVAAQRLAAGLLPPGGAGRDHCVLLVPREGGQLTAYSFRIQDFRPLIENSGWKCQVEMAPRPGPAITGVSLAAQQNLLDSTTAAYRAAVQGTANTLWRQETARLEADLAARQTKLKDLATQIEKSAQQVKGEIENREAQLQQQRNRLGQLAAGFGEIDRGLGLLKPDLHSLLGQLATDQKKYEEARRLLNRVIGILRETQALARTAAGLEAPGQP